MYAVVNLLQTIISLIIAVLLVHVVLSWLISFQIVSRSQPFVSGVYNVTTKLTDPMLRPLRKLIPPVAGLDLSVLVLALGLQFLSNLLPELLL